MMMMTEHCFPEHLPVVGARIEALRAHGCAPAALRLAVSAVRAMRHRQVRMMNFTLSTYIPPKLGQYGVIFINLFSESTLTNIFITSSLYSQRGQAEHT